MRSAGVQVNKYHPLRWYNLGRMNNRTHRKLLVVDGRIGFTGGVGIAEKWTGHAQDPDHWRDSHFMVEGPVVAQMQAVFNDNWVKTTGKVLHGAEYFPPLAAVGSGRAQMFSSSPTGGSESMHLMYLLAITAAQHSIELSSSYFVPDDLTRKAMVEDCLLTSVGSTNFDDRSFRLNDEANLNIYDAGVARQQIAVFEQDLQRSRRITLDQWRNRPLSEKAWEKVAALLGPLL